MSLMEGLLNSIETALLHEWDVSHLENSFFNDDKAGIILQTYVRHLILI